MDRDTGLIAMDEVERVAHHRRPRLIPAGWSAYPRALDFARFRAIADEVGAYLLVDMAYFAAPVAAGVYTSPVRGRPDRRGRLSRPAERPLQHVIAGKAVALRIAASEAFPERQSARSRELGRSRTSCWQPARKCSPGAPILTS